MGYYYAVRVGRRPGIYESWSDCAENVIKYSGAIYKKFRTRAEAQNFMKPPYTSYESPNVRVQNPEKPTVDQGENEEVDSDYKENILPEIQHNISKKRKCATTDLDSARKRRSESELSIESPLIESSSNKSFQSAPTCSNIDGIVYCDGCCFNNGKPDAKAGIGVYWSQPDLPDISERLSGKQSNQRAELVAACRALQSALDHKLKKIEVRTDSRYTINAVTEWIRKWKLNGWKTNSGDVKNKADIVRLHDLNSQLTVIWTHVRGHSNEPGNEKADQLAKDGANKC